MTEDIKKSLKELAKKRRREAYLKAKELRKKQLQAMKEDPAYIKMQDERKEKAKHLRRAAYLKAKEKNKQKLKDQKLPEEIKKSPEPAVKKSGDAIEPVPDKGNVIDFLVAKKKIMRAIDLNKGN